MRSGLALAAFLPLLLIAGCDAGSDDGNVGGITTEEAAQLNAAAEMLDASPDDLTLPPENAAAPVER